MTHVGKIYEYFPQVVGVSPSLFSLGFNEFLNIQQRGTPTALNPVEELYTPRGSQSAIIGKAYADALNLRTDFNSSFFLVIYNNSYTKQHEMRVISTIRVKVSSVLNTAPALTFS